MRTHRILITLSALVLLAPAMASAQEPQPLRATAVYRYAQRGTLGIFTQPVPPGSPSARRQHIIDVVEGSPAEKAGIMKGDTLLSINDLAASHQVMSLPFEPGDTVVLRVLRDGRERDITVVAGARTQYTAWLSDSIGERVSVAMLRLRERVADTVSFPRMRVYRYDDDSTNVVIMGSDTIHAVHIGPRSFTYAVGGLPPDSVRRLFGSMQIHADSLRLRGDSLWHSGSLRFQWDSLDTRFGSIRRLFPDSSIRWHFEERLPGFYQDSAGFHLFTNDSAGGWSFRTPDSTFVRGFDMLTTTATLGMRAVAGAELAPLNPGLSEYFGATDGVLVLNAREGTPAARAGLRAGDVIVRVGDTAVRSIAELRRTIGRAPDGAVTLGVLRRGQNVTVTLNR
jgi:membrane-associated protease RseP (regulator of RpoE activity)